MDGNTLVGSMCVRGPATVDSISFQRIVRKLLPDEFIFFIKINTSNSANVGCCLSFLVVVL